MAHDRLFPCCLCGHKLDVRETKKGKPYVICNSCGMQMFVRLNFGIQTFYSLIANKRLQDSWQRLEQLVSRFQKTCPDCRQRFWIDDELVVTSRLTGSFTGYRCPDKNCVGIVKAEVKKA
jgi:hypothetical protein